MALEVGLSVLTNHKHGKQTPAFNSWIKKWRVDCVINSSCPSVVSGIGFGSFVAHGKFLHVIPFLKDED